MKKHLLLTTLLCAANALSSFGLSRTYTIDDLVSGTWEVSEAQYRYYPFGTYGKTTGDLYEAFKADLLYATNLAELSFEKQDENTILVKGMFGGLMDIPFTYDSATGKFTMEANATSGGDPVFLVNNPVNRPDISKIILSPCNVYQDTKTYNIVRYYTSENWYSSQFSELEGTRDESGNYDLSVSFDNRPIELQITYTNENVEKIYIDTYQLDLFKPTLTITDTKVKDEVSTNREYRGEFEYTDDNTFRMAGLGGQYAGLAPELKSINRGNFYYFGTYGLYLETGIATYYYSNIAHFTGSFDLSAGTALLNTCGYSVKMTPNWNSFGSKKLYNFNVREVVGSTWQDNVRGTVEIIGPATHLHNVDFWISDGGSCTTWTKLKFNFNDWQSVYLTQTADENIGLIKNTTFIPDKKYEITHQVDFDQVAVAYHANHPGEEQDVLWIKGQLDANSIKNSMYVDHYELHLLPGSYTTVSGDEFNNADKGHDNGLNISDESFHHAYYPNDIATYAEGDKTDAEKAQEVIDANSNGQFCRLVKKSDFDTAGIEMDPNNQYTLYLKTVYTGASDLEPTFHALTSVNGTTTGVDNIVNEENIADINVNGATVTISGSNGNALVVTTSGVVVYQGGDNTVTLTPGMYIVRADKLTKRIIIK